jgi:hypothetical protein
VSGDRGDLTDPNEPWPWDQAPNVAALTVRSILEGAPILYVFHDADDDGGSSSTACRRTRARLG